MTLMKYKAWLGVATGIIAALLVSLSPAMVRAGSYNCGAYGAGTYQNNVCAATTDEGGGLADTGQSIWAILIAVLLILLGTYLLYRTRKKMKQREASALKK